MLTMIQDWHTHQLDFFLAYPQAEVEGDIYMKLPKGFSLSGGRSSKTHVLKLLKNINGLKQASRVWNVHLHKGLVELGYQQSKLDPCLYYREKPYWKYT